MNSLRSLERAIDYEIKRQSSAIENGESIIQETRHWDESKETTTSMRSKEGSADYRYFSDPDLPNMVLPDEFVNQVKESLPSLPHENRNKLVETGLDLSDSNVLSKSEKWILELYFEVFDNTKDSKATFNWITGELQGQMRKLEIKSLPEWFSPDFLSDIIQLIDANKISFTSGKVILEELIQKDTTPDDVAKKLDLYQENDESAISEIVEEVIKNNQDIVERIKNGEDKLVGFMVGQIIKSSGGSINPGIAKEILSKELNL